MKALSSPYWSPSLNDQTICSVTRCRLQSAVFPSHQRAARGSDNPLGGRRPSVSVLSAICRSGGQPTAMPAHTVHPSTHVHQRRDGGQLPASCLLPRLVCWHCGTGEGRQLLRTVGQLTCAGGSCCGLPPLPQCGPGSCWCEPCLPPVTICHTVCHCKYSLQATHHPSLLHTSHHRGHQGCRRRSNTQHYTNKYSAIADCSQETADEGETSRETDQIESLSEPISSLTETKAAAPGWSIRSIK